MSGDSGIHAATSTCSEGNSSTALNSYLSTTGRSQFHVFFLLFFFGQGFDFQRVTMNVDVTFLHGNANTNQGVDRVYELHIQIITLRSLACRLHYQSNKEHVPQFLEQFSLGNKRSKISSMQMVDNIFAFKPKSTFPVDYRSC